MFEIVTAGGIVMGLLLLASLVAILTTFGIVLSLLFESIRFFGMVSPVEFLTGSLWSPAGEPGQVRLRPLALPVRRVAVEGQRRPCAAPGA